MQKYYLAVDIGASGGRHILGHMENGKMVTEEIYRFPNGMAERNGQKCWDVERLFSEIKAGMKKCASLGKIPYSMGIDTWAVDFVLLDGDGKRLGNAVAYRDGRTRGMEKKVRGIFTNEELYARTGIQKQPFNTVYQLMAVKEQQPELLKKAEKLLMIPDYFHYLLTGKMAAEYTNVTTTQLVSPKTRDWDFGLIESLGIPEMIFPKITQPGTVLGNLRSEVQKEVGFDCVVTLPATHDTASAVLAVPAKEESFVYISSGTWSLLGTELFHADCSEKSRVHNFTNEGGYAGRIRYLKNIMGLWMIQSVRAELAPEMSYAELCAAAAREQISSAVDCNDSRFLAPESMTKEVQAACKGSCMQIPEGVAQTAAVIYQSLAQCYAGTVAELEECTGKTYGSIHIVGGGANAAYLNKLTAAATRKTVFAGPTEATAIGNLAAQFIAAGELADLKEARECIRRSFEIKEYRPN